MICAYCDEPILEKEERIALMGGEYHHYECDFRAIVGSVAHILERCSCFVPGSTENDPEGVTRREAAKAAVEAWEKSEWARR